MKGLLFSGQQISVTWFTKGSLLCTISPIELGCGTINISVYKEFIFRSPIKLLPLNKPPIKDNY